MSILTKFFKKRGATPTPEGPAPADTSTTEKNPNNSKFPKEGLTNAAIGLGQLAGNRRPENPRPSLFRSFIRPAQGNEQMVQRGKNAIAEQVGSATKDINTTAGSSLSANIAGRTEIQKNAMKAESDLLGKNAEIFRQDQKRADDQINQDARLNTMTENEFTRQNFDRDYNEFLLKNQAAMTSIQGGIDATQKRGADLENKSIAERQTNIQIDMEAEKAREARRLEGIRNQQSPEAIEEGLSKNPINYDKYKTYNYNQKKEHGGKMMVYRRGIPKLEEGGSTPPGKPKKDIPVTGGKPVVTDPKSPRSYLDRTLAMNYPGRSLEELDVHMVPVVPGQPDTHEMDVLRRSHKPSIRVESQLPLAGKNPYRPTLSDFQETQELLAQVQNSENKAVPKKKSGGKMKYKRKC